MQPTPYFHFLFHFFFSFFVVIFSLFLFSDRDFTRLEHVSLILFNEKMLHVALFMSPKWKAIFF